jgi:hypothetical protein
MKEGALRRFLAAKTVPTMAPEYLVNVGMWVRKFRCTLMIIVEDMISFQKALL